MPRAGLVEGSKAPEILHHGPRCRDAGGAALFLFAAIAARRALVAAPPVARFGSLPDPLWVIKSRCTVPSPTPSTFAACRWLMPLSISFRPCRARRREGSVARTMPSRRLSFSPTGRDIADAKASARRAYALARKASGFAPVLIDQVWADTLLRVEGQPRETAAEMLRRTEHLFMLLRDRASWPR
jgi:hypothetical protein